MIPVCILALEDENERSFMIALYNQYNRLMYSVARSIVQNDSDAEDIVQEVFTQIIEKDKIPLLRALSKQQIASYVAEASKNKAKNRIRNKTRSRVSGELLEDVLPYDEDMEESVINSIALDELRSALQKLKEDTRDLLIKKYYLDMSDEEIGKELGLKATSVRMKLTRARREVLRIINEKNGRYNN